MIYDQIKLSSNWEQGERRHGFKWEYQRIIMGFYFGGEGKENDYFTVAERLKIISSALIE